MWGAATRQKASEVNGGLLDPEIEVRPSEGQMEDIYGEIRQRIDAGERSLILTLTKKWPKT